MACTLYFSDGVKVKERLVAGGKSAETEIDGKTMKVESLPVYGEAEHSLVTTIPLSKTTNSITPLSYSLWATRLKTGAGSSLFQS